jgi:HD superfamily phosphohydrolase
MPNYQIIQDTVHGSVKLDGMALELIDEPFMQRLNAIRQLGLCYLVFPGANHSRLEHSLGAYHLADKVCNELEVSEDEATQLKAAGMLHDVGHGPFSHVLETVLHRKTGMNHMEIGTGIIEGGLESYLGEKNRIPEILEKHGISPKDISILITGSSKAPTLYDFPFPRAVEKEEDAIPHYIKQLMHSTIDIDQIDYLLRDSHYTGVAHGGIDADRLMRTLRIHKGDLAVDRKGVPAVEGMLVARGLMYSSIYFHKTGRIAQNMMARAVENMEEVDFMTVQRMIDAELITELVRNPNEHAKTIGLHLRHRHLFKGAFFKLARDISDDEKQMLQGIVSKEERFQVEAQIAERLGIPQQHVIIDIPAPDLLLSEPRIMSSSISILEGEQTVPLYSCSPLARALQHRNVSDWVLMVAVPKKNREEAAKIAPKAIFG